MPTKEIITDNMLTLVIPTYNRPKELERLLNFQSGLAHQLTIIVLDGSAPDSGEINQKICQKFDTVSYYEFPSSMHLGVRLTEGLKLVKTPYIVFCGDDDFVFPEAAIECAQYLQSNLGYAAAIGQVWSLRYFLHRKIIRGGIALGRDLNFGNKFDHERFIQRSLFYFAYTAVGSIPLFYAVRRTEQTLRAFSLITGNLKYSSMELLTNCSLLVDGKVAKLPIPFGLRDYASVTTRDLEREGAETYVPLEDIQYMRPLLVLQLMHAESLTREIAEYLVDSLLSLWINDNKIPSFVRDESKAVKRMRQFALYAQCVAGRIAPSMVSNVLGLPPQVYASLLQAHRRFLMS